MTKVDFFKYTAFALILLVLILPQNNNAWIWALVLAGSLIIFWVFKNFGSVGSWKYMAILLVFPLFLLDTSSTLFKWLLFVIIAGIVVWILRKYILKKE